MKSKEKIVWCCAECGHSQKKWVGQCPQCQNWNTLHEEVDLQAISSRFSVAPSTPAKPIPIDEVEADETSRLSTNIGELDRLLGGGIVRGSLILVGGDPGIGKSTLLLQASCSLARQGLIVLYVCGEESVMQTSLRAKRIGVSSENLFLFSETHLGAIKAQIEKLSPDILIVDSIQILYKPEIPSAPGSVSQVRETAAELMHLSKRRNLSTFLIGHVTKSGEIAGPRVLEHLVDTVLYFEGDRQHNYRLMRVVKNRFGSTDEIAVFQMGKGGLAEIPNPSEIFLEERMRGSAGSVIIPTVEGSRPILIEVQALVTDTAFTTPSRRSAGLDSNRLALLLAVLEKRVGYQLHSRDVFVSVAGGFKITEPAIDLGVILAVASSLTNRLVDPDTVVIGEVGLAGEVRTVPRIEERLKEAAHMGFSKALVPKKSRLGETFGIECQGIERVEEAIYATIG
ncbi:MAG: DNA repair protein RadA [Chlamydiae bacterium]|nr:DNA repair protein RadA [Chlamydiota bacterium]